MDEFIRWLKEGIAATEKYLAEGIGGFSGHNPTQDIWNRGYLFALRKTLQQTNALRDAAAQGDEGTANEPEDGGLVDCDSE